MAHPWVVFYIVHTKPGQLDEAMREAPKALYAENRMRMFQFEGRSGDLRRSAILPLKAIAAWPF